MKWLFSTLLLVTAFGAGAADSAMAARGSAEITEVVEAERAFARMAEEKGIRAAFLSFAAEDGVVFDQGPEPAKPAVSAWPAGDGGSLRWWPLYAGIAGSGDLGFTTGPFISENGDRRGYGHYFTVWKRQGDGSWKWVLDHGPPTSEASPSGLGSPVASLPAAHTPKKSRTGSAWAELEAAEAALAQGLAADAHKALPAFLAEDGRVMRAGPQPAIGRTEYLALIASGPTTIMTGRLGGGISKAGDLAYTYGSARWNEGSARLGHYVRVWQRRAEGWKLIVDELIASPPAPPAAG
jgi:ketosteroid isomerase-like protein